MKQQNVAMRVSFISVIVNLVLAIFKLIAGIVANSGAMISDAVHSASDVCSTFIVMIGIRVSNRQSDKEHPYGHERLESVASLILAIMLAVTGAGIGYSSAMVIHNGSVNGVKTPGLLALIAAIVSIVVKEWLYWYTRGQAKKINSTALMADAWHHRSDALSSIGALIGIAGARMGYPLLDPIAGLVICVFIEKAAVDIFKDSLDRMVDKSCSEEVVEQINDIILKVEGVEGIDDIKTRLFGAKIYVDVEILVDGNKSLREAHDIAENVHDLIEETMPEVKHCMVHENPR